MQSQRLSLIAFSVITWVSDVGLKTIWEFASKKRNKALSVLKGYRKVAVDLVPTLTGLTISEMTPMIDLADASTNGESRDMARCP